MKTARSLDTASTDQTSLHQEDLCTARDPRGKEIDGIYTRERVLNIAEELFFTQGYSETSMREIARAACVTPTAIYRHFAGKEAVLKDIIDPVITEFWNMYETACAQFIQNLKDPQRKDEVLRELFTHDDTFWVLSLIDQHPKHWDFILFKSTGTPYETFVDELIDRETEITFECIKIAAAHNRYARMITYEEIRVLIESHMHTCFRTNHSSFPNNVKIRAFSTSARMMSHFFAELILPEDEVADFKNQQMLFAHDISVREKEVV